jgi:hypothetical protein
MKWLDDFIDKEPENDPEGDRHYREVMISVSIEQIALARSRDKKIALCAAHLGEFYKDHPDLAVIACVLSGEKIERPQDLGNVGIQIRVDEIRENENISFEDAVERFASRANMSVSAVKKAITQANKEI